MGDAGPPGSGVIWKDARGTIVPAVGTMPLYFSTLNEGMGALAVLYADAKGHMWGVYPSGRSTVALFPSPFFATTNCTGQQYLFGVPARYVIGTALATVTGLGALKDNATATVVQAQSTYLGGTCTPTGMNPLSMFAETPANMDIDIPDPGSSPYQFPFHPEYSP